MSKKSYMNTKNILSEGLINKLIGILIPKKVREKMKKPFAIQLLLFI